MARISGTRARNLVFQKWAIRNHWAEILSFFFLSILFWLTHYYQINDFGLYEDDITYLPTAFSFSFSELMRHIWDLISHLYGHGRPLHDSFVNLFGWVGYQLHGLPGAYWVGFALSILNMFLFYLLVRRVSNQRLALLSALAFCFYTTDTTRIYLTHSLGVQPSITLLLLASHFYLSDKKWLAYGVAFLILFSYETPFLVFIGTPILMAKWDRRFMREMIKHVLIILSMLFLVFIIRLLLGEGRVLKLSGFEVIWQSISLVFRGMLANLKDMYVRPGQVIVQMTAPVLTIVLLVFSSLTVFLLFLGHSLQQKYAPSINSMDRAHHFGKFGRLLNFFLAGVIMLAASYPIAFNLYATVLDGRGSRVHAAAILGASLLIGALLEWIVDYLAEKPLRFLAFPILAAVLSLHAGFGFVIQNEYRLAWRFEKEYWSALLPLIQDASNNDLILVDELDIPEVSQIQANTWNVPRILSQLYRMPDDWANPPIVYPLLPDWRDGIIDEKGALSLDIHTVNAPPSFYGEYSPDSIIFIYWDENSGKVVRRRDPLLLNGYPIMMKQPGFSVLNQFPKGILFFLMFPSG